MGSYNSDQKDGSSDWRSKMKLFYDDTVEPAGKRPCDGVREDLRECLMTSDCYLKQRKSLKECMKANDGSVPNECMALRTTFFDCKRSLKMRPVAEQPALVLFRNILQLPWTTGSDSEEEKDTSFLMETHPF